MKKNNWKERSDIVYSTDPDFKYNIGEENKQKTTPKDKQLLKISLDKRNRGGKAVTLITGFTGKEEDLEELGKFLKVKCGVGGSAKNSEIIIQGDFRKKIWELLLQEGYSKSRII